MGEILYQRDCRIILAPEDHAGGVAFKSQHARIKPSDTGVKEATEVPGFRISFKVVQSIDSKLNTADATVYNLRESSRARLSSLAPKKGTQKAPRFIIEAGYSAIEDTVAGLFVGTATKIGHEKQKDGWETKISASDGVIEQSKIVNLSVAPGTPVKDVFQSMADQMKISVKEAHDLAKQGKLTEAFDRFKQGFSFSGPARTAMDKIGKIQNADVSIQDGELQLIDDAAIIDDVVVILTQATGLIGSPTLEFQKAKNKARTILRCRSLLQPRIRPGRRVRIKSQEIQGDYKIIQVTHSGDTHGSDWYSDVEALEFSFPQQTITYIPHGFV